MNYVPKIDRRSFVVGTAAAGAGFSLGMSLPFGAAYAQDAQGTPELNAWVVVQPDDTVVDPLRPLRDGPGRADRALPAGRRRARMRLGEGDLGIREPAPRTSPASASTGNFNSTGSRTRSASRTTMCAAAAPPRGRC